MRGASSWKGLVHLTAPVAGRGLVQRGITGVKINPLVVVLTTVTFIQKVKNLVCEIRITLSEGICDM